MNTGWEQIDAWTRIDSPWLFQPRPAAQSPEHRVLRDAMPRLSTYRQAIALALIGSDRLTPRQAILARRIVRR